MNEQARQLKAFLDALLADPRDVTTRRVLADWYDDHDEPELADEQRRWSLSRYDAEQYLRNFAAENDGGAENWQRMLGGLLRGDYCFSDDGGPSAARYDEQLWDAVPTLGEEDLPDEHFTKGSYHCAC